MKSNIFETPQSASRGGSGRASPESGSAPAAPPAEEAPHGPARVPREPGRVRILVVDNYDSFTYNLVQLIETLGADVEVVRNDAASPGALAARRASGVVLSPGPGTPGRAGATLGLVERCAADGVPLLGVCLGHQAIGVAFGARLRGARMPRHGKTACLRHDGAGVFAGLANPARAALYHSLVIDDLPDVLCAAAHGPEGDVMAVRHRSLPIDGVQFHPESVLMPGGARIVQNFLARCEEAA